MTNEIWEHVYLSLTDLKNEKQRLYKMGDEIGLMPESIIYETLHNISYQLIETLSLLVNDEDEWIDWFVNENRYGGGELEAGINGDIKKIRTLVNLRWLIELSEL